MVIFSFHIVIQWHAHLKTHKKCLMDGIYANTDTHYKIVT